MTNKQMQDLKVLANAYAGDRVEGYVNELKVILDGLLQNPKPIVPAEKQYKILLGKILGIAYAKGYADCAEKIEPKRSIFLS